MQKRYFKTLFFTLLLLYVNSAFAQDVKIQSYTSGTQITLDQRFEFSIKVSGKTQSLPDPSFPDLSAFYILSGPNQSSNYQYVNGKLSASKTYTYILKAREIGTFTLPAVNLQYKGQSQSTKAINIKVLKAAPQPKNKKGSSKDGISSDALFLRAHFSKKSAYVGEQIIVEYKLYFKQQVQTYELAQQPAFTGFWTEDFELPRQPLIQTEVINGVNYNVATLKKVALFGTKIGKMIINPMAIHLEVLIPNKKGNRRRSLFDSFFEPQGRSVTKTLSSKKHTLNIKALPQTGKPASFNGAVGRYNIKADLTKTELNVNDAVTLKLTVSGSGNIKILEMPQLKFPPDIEQYDPKSSSKINKNNNTISGHKKTEYILIPRIPGSYELDPIRFSYFDPKQKKYIEKSAHIPTLTVGGTATASPNAPMAGFSRKEVTLLGKDIRFIKEQSNFVERDSGETLNRWLFVWFGLPFFLFLAFIFWDDKQARLSGNVVLAKNKNAGKIANAFLKSAAKELHSGNDKHYFKLIHEALARFVQDKLNIALSEFNTKNVSHALKQKNIPQELITEYAALISECEFNQFAGASSGQDKQLLYNKAKNLLTKMEKFI